MTQHFLEKMDTTMLTMFIIMTMFLMMILYTMINTTAFITAISTMLMIFLICATILFLMGSSFASFILYISAIAGISVLLSYCLTMIPKISTSTTMKMLSTNNFMSKPSKNKKFIMVIILLMTTINIFSTKFLAFSSSTEKSNSSLLNKEMEKLQESFLPSKTVLLNINQNILSSPFWGWTSLFLSIVLFMLMISSLKMISSLSSPMGPTTISKK